MRKGRALLQEEIIRVAASCFGEQGYRATTLETIAARAGVSKVTLYRYVASKEELLCQVFQRTIAPYRIGLRQIIDQRLPADETLRRIIRYQVTVLTSHLPFLRVFFSEESGLPPQMAKRVAREKRQVDRSIEKVVREGVAGGRLRGLPPTLVVFALLGMCNWLYKWYRPDGKLAPDEIGRIFVDLLEQGYLRRTGGEADAVLKALGRVEERVAELSLRVGLSHADERVPASDRARRAERVGHGRRRR